MASLNESFVKHVSAKDQFPVALATGNWFLKNAPST
jgi:hypothetical protein